jgi:hypothetical protein
VLEGDVELRAGETLASLDPFGCVKFRSVISHRSHRLEPLRFACRAAVATLLALMPAGGVARAKQSHIVVPAGVLTVAQPGSFTTLELTTHDRTQRLRLPADNSTIISAGTFQGADLVGSVGRKVLVLSTTYASQTGRGGPDAQCAAGQEIILRVVALSPTPHQTFTTPLESCWGNIYRMPVSWDARTASFTLGDGAGSLDDREPGFYVLPDGAVRQAVPLR